MAGAWDPTKDSGTPTWTYQNSDREVKHSGGNYPAFGNSDVEFDSDTSGGDGIIFGIEVVQDSSGSLNGNATFGFCDSTQPDNDQIAEHGVTYTRSGVLYVDNVFQAFGLPAVNVGDEVAFAIADDTLEGLWVGATEVIDPGTPGDHFAFTNKTDFVPMCNPRLSSGSAYWRLNSLAADIVATIESGYAALESAGGGPTARPRHYGFII